jgi:predicted permease
MAVQLAGIFLNVLTPVFLLVITGYLIGPPLGIETRTLSKIAYYVLTPAFIFNVFSSASLAVGLAVRMALFSIVVAGLCVLCAVLLARLLGLGEQMAGAFALTAAFANVGNFGLPIIQFRLGDAALAPASFYFLVLSTFGFVVGVSAATWHKGNAGSALLAALKTPAILAVFPAIAVNALDLPTPLFLERSVGLLASAMIPIMLLALGVQLAGMGKLHIDRNVAMAGALRLVVGPIFGLLLAAPFGLTGIERGAGILQASMPAAVLAALVAMEHELMPDFVATVVLFSTLAGAVTLTVVLAIV